MDINTSFSILFLYHAAASQVIYTPKEKPFRGLNANKCVLKRSSFEKHARPLILDKPAARIHVGLLSSLVPDLKQ